MHKILYHRDPDGLASAAVVYGYLTQQGVADHQIVTHSVQYGEELPPIDLAGDRVYMVDFSAQPVDGMFYLARHLGGRFTWIDHHATSVDAEAEHPELKDVPGRRLVNFPDSDLPISGCELTYLHLFGNKPMPRVLELIGDWDTWRWKALDTGHTAKPWMYYMNTMDISSPGSVKDLADVLFAYDEADTKDFIQDGLRYGEAIESYVVAKNRTDAQELAFEATFLNLYPAIVMNNRGNSEIFASVYNPDKHKLMVGFQINKHYMVTCSLYSTDPHVHCGHICKTLGGGGHKGAAGFQVPFERFRSMLSPLD